MRDFIRKFFDIKFWKFIGVGLINTAVGYGVMFLLYNVAHASYWLSSAANYVVGSAISYFLNKHFTFRNTEKSLRVVLRFVINISICYLLAYGAAKPLAAKLLEGSPKNIQENIAMLVGAVLYVGLNYIGQRFFAFREKNDPQ